MTGIFFRKRNPHPHLSRASSGADRTGTDRDANPRMVDDVRVDPELSYAILFLVVQVTDHDEKFVRNLSAAGHETCIFSFHARQVDPRLAIARRTSPWNADPAARACRRLQRFLPIHLLPRLRACIRRFQPDVIHAGNTWNESFLGALSGFHPLLVMPYGSDVLLDTQRNPWFAFANRNVFRAADWVTCDAEHVKKKAHRGFLVSRGEDHRHPLGDRRGVHRAADRVAAPRYRACEARMAGQVHRDHDPQPRTGVWHRCVPAGDGGSVRAEHEHRVSS